MRAPAAFPALTPPRALSSVTTSQRSARRQHTTRVLDLAVAAVLLVSVPVVLMLITGLLDMWLHHEESLLAVLSPDADAAAWTLALVGTSEGVAIAIVIVVVVLGIQLSADRYSPRVIEIFIGDPLNTGVIALFLGSIVYTIWISTEVKADFVPYVGLYTSVALAFMDFSVLLPYLRHLFGIMRGEMIIGSVHHEASTALRTAFRTGGTLRLRHEFRESLDQLYDIVLGAGEERDTELCMSALEVLRKLLVEEYIPNKPQLNQVWFRVGHEDMLGIAPEVIQEVDSTQTWVEYKVMSHLLSVIGETASFRKEVIHAIAGTTREIAVAAGSRGKDKVVDLAIRFFNTYLRAAINQRAPTFGYAIMSEYRRLATELGERKPELTVVIAEHLLRYGHAFELGAMHSAAGTAAEDVVDLTRNVARKHPAAGAPMAAQLGRYVVELKQGAHRSAFVGALNSVLKLALEALAEGWEPILDPLLAALRELPPDEVDGTLDRMRTTVDWHFWEVSDRVTTFHYVAPELRARIGDLNRRIREGSPEALRATMHAHSPME